MKTFRLPNGLTILFEKTNAHSVTAQVMVRVGSNNETKRVAGISHFLEHMLFEGTKNRANSRDIANEIEKYGAEFNAYTTGDRTAYYIKIINKRFDKALEILSDMIINSVFEQKFVEKERKVILREIDMVTDDPRQHQWIIFQSNIYDKHPSKEPTYGTVKAVKSMSRKDIINYYKKYYAPNNMIVSIVGNVSNVPTKVKKYFGKMKRSSFAKRKTFVEALQKKRKKAVQKRNIGNSYMVLGCRAPYRTHKDSYAMDVIHAILGRGQSGWMFEEIRNKRGLAYQVGVQYEAEKDYGYLAVYCGLPKSKINLAEKIIIEQFRKLETIGKKELDEAKNYFEGHHTLQTEDTFHAADNQAYWHTIKDAKLAHKHINKVKKVTVTDVKRVAKKYLTDKCTIAVVQQK